MSGSTTELNLKTAVDSDDTADYLTLSLADSLRTLDALFNQVTGHNHGSAHQGGPVASVPVAAIPDGSITSAKLKPPIDIGDWFRSTGHPTPMATTGVGLEMFYDSATITGVVQSYDRAASSWRNLRLGGNTVVLQGNNGLGLTIDGAGQAAFGSHLAVSGQITTTSGGNGVIVAGAGSLYLRSAGGGGSVVIDTGTGGLNVASGPINAAGQIASGQRITSGTDLVINNGNLFLGSQGDTVLSRNNAGDIRINNRLTFDRDSGGGPAQISWPGGASVANGTSVGRNGGTVYLSPHCFIFFDLEVGHVVTCQQVIQTSDPNLKAGMTVMADTTCMTRIRNPSVSVYTYQLPPPTPPPDDSGLPTPTQNDIGFDATQVFAVAPEFAALNASNQPVGVNYANMAAMLWGALRDLDKRCTAYGIPA